MQTRAAILVELGQPLELVDLDIPALQPGQVLVQLAHSGVCHTQLLEARGDRGPDKFLPHCLGHEGSGIVREIGSGVTRVKPGDRVVLSWIKSLGCDVPGSKYSWNGRSVNAGAITTFSEHAVISENRLTVLDAVLAFDAAALLGCAIPTGLGTVFNTAQVRPGQAVVVFGAGGIGLWAIAGAVLSGASPVIAVDLLPEKLNRALDLGASHTICAATEPVIETLLKICPGGVDVAIEASGRPAVMQQAVEAVRMQGGVAAIAGNARFGESWALDPRQLNLGKRILGTWGGDNLPERDFPRYQRLIRDGRLDCSRFVNDQYPLTEINRALADLAAGKVARPLIALNPALEA